MRCRYSTGIRIQRSRLDDCSGVIDYARGKLIVHLSVDSDYHMCLHTGTRKIEAVMQYGLLNIGRFMRNEFIDKEIFANIFGGHGGWPDDTLVRLVQPHNPGKRFLDIVEQI
jgi:hypothetical protein